MRLISAVFALLAGILLLPQTRAYLEEKQKEAEIVYTNLGTATIRIVDPEQRRGIAVEGAWTLSR